LFDTSCSPAGAGLHRGTFRRTDRLVAGEVAISVADHTRHDTISGIARAVLATAPNRFALCGLSMGGSIAFEMVRQAPDRIERLALLDTSALSDTPEQTERRLQLIAMAQTGEFKSVRDPLWPLFVQPARHDNVALKRAVFKMMDDTGPETFIRQQKAIMSRSDSRLSLGAIHCPTLVRGGIVGSKLDIVQDCRHLSIME